MKYYAVIDTNVIVAALLSKNSDAATVKILKELAGGSIIPLYHSEILAEYEEVLSRDKFPIAQTTVAKILGIVRRFGVQANPVQTDEIFQDLDDRIFTRLQWPDAMTGLILLRATNGIILKNIMW